MCATIRGGMASKRNADEGGPAPKRFAGAGESKDTAIELSPTPPPAGAPSPPKPSSLAMATGISDDVLDEICDFGSGESASGSPAASAAPARPRGAFPELSGDPFPGASPVPPGCMAYLKEMWARSAFEGDDLTGVLPSLPLGGSDTVRGELRAIFSTAGTPLDVVLSTPRKAIEHFFTELRCNAHDGKHAKLALCVHMTPREASAKCITEIGFNSCFNAITPWLETAGSNARLGPGTNIMLVNSALSCKTLPLYYTRSADTFYGVLSIVQLYDEEETQARRVSTRYGVLTTPHEEQGKARAGVVQKDCMLLPLGYVSMKSASLSPEAKAHAKALPEAVNRQCQRNSKAEWDLLQAATLRLGDKCAYSSPEELYKWTEETGRRLLMHALEPRISRPTFPDAHKQIAGECGAWYGDAMRLWIHNYGQLEGRFMLLHAPGFAVEKLLRVQIGMLVELVSNTVLGVTEGDRRWFVRRISKLLSSTLGFEGNGYWPFFCHKLAISLTEAAYESLRRCVLNAYSSSNAVALVK